MKIGILRETKTPFDKRVAITPSVAKKILEKYDNVELLLQPCSKRAFSEAEYRRVGVLVAHDLSECDLLIGVKEVDVSSLITKGTYLFFAHVGKKQKSNQHLIQRMVELENSLFDYEYFVDENRQRLISFGYWAGMIGTYNSIVALYRKYYKIMLSLPQTFNSIEELFQFADTLQLPAWRFLLTGTGRVGAGASEMLKKIGVKRVAFHDYLTQSYSYPVFCQLSSSDYMSRKNGKAFDLIHFYENPDDYFSVFLPFCSVTDAIINCHYWHPKAPILFPLQAVKLPDFEVQVIADITCDLEGSIPCTLKVSTLEFPFYDYNPDMDGESAPFSSLRHVSMMSVDNLSNALARDASESFSQVFLDSIFPHLMQPGENTILKGAKILHDGKLTDCFDYLEDYVSTSVES